VATLLNTNGVTNATAAAPYNGVGNSASYGRLTENGASASQQFTFKANASNDQTILVTFKLEDVVGANRRQLGTGVFTLTAGSHTLSYSNTASITILDSTNAPTKASFYPSTINVPNTNGTVAKATVTFVGLGHTYPDDIDALLVGPGAPAPNTLLMAAVGGPFGFNNVRLTFDDAFPALPNEGSITTGTNRPTLGTAASEPSFYPTFPAIGVTPPPPAPPSGGQYPVSLSVFKGINPTGDWRLYLVDSTPLDNGVMSGGWMLNLTIGASVEQAADLGIAISSAPAPATVSNIVVLHVDFTNYGPATATNIVVTAVLPPGMTFLSNDCACTMTATTNGLQFPLATLAKDQHAFFDIYVRGDVLGTFGNSVSIKSANPDHNPNNDSATALVEVNSPSADMAATISLSPNPVLINNNVTITMTAVNNGFSPAIGVMLTNQLPAGLSFASASSSVGSISTNTTGLVIASLGDLTVGASPTVTIVATATNQVTSLVTARVGSSTFDPLKGNNTASAKIEIDGPPLSVSAQNNGLLLSWPASAGNLLVEQTTSLAPPAVWTAVADGTVSVVNGQYQLQVSSSNAVRFFRLRAQ
jgi:uncharacterized repeat protein (TIGR01451 family)